MVLSSLGFLGDLPIWFMQYFTIDELLYQWQLIGVFSFILPFLLIFAVIFGALTNTGILGGHKGVNLIISLVIALMALQLGFVQVFFTELFPRFGVGLAILIVVVILAALFIPDQHKKGWTIGFAAAGAIIGVGALIATFASPNIAWFDSYFWQDNWGLIIGGILMLVIIIALFVGASKRPEPATTISFGPWHGNPQQH